MNGTRPDEIARLAKLAPRLREALAASGRYAVVAIDPVEARAKAQNLLSCGGCDRSLARELGANIDIVGQVQKVSALILNMTIYIRDVDAGRDIRVEFRGHARRHR